MLDAFMLRALMAGAGLALAAGPLGCFVVWRRMAYFGDATAHAAILGVALSLALSMSIFAGTLGVALVMALLISGLTGRGWTIDTTLGVLAHSALAFGLIAISFVHGVRVDLEAYLFGDILAVSWRDLAVIWLGAALVAGLMAWRWPRLLATTLSEELAVASGLDPRRERMVLTVAMAIVVAVAIKIVGALLIAAMLIIPAAAARGIARTPEAMALSAIAVGAVSAFAGVGASYFLDTPAGPSVVASAAVIFTLSVLAGRLSGRGAGR